MTKIEFSSVTNNYFMDVEYEALTCWDNSLYPVNQYLTGHKRLYCEEWLKLIKQNIDMYYYENYLLWVQQGGG